MPTKQSIAEQPSANSKKASRELERAIARLGELNAGTGAGATSNNYRQLNLKTAAEWLSGHACCEHCMTRAEGNLGVADLHQVQGKEGYSIGSLLCLTTLKS